MKKLIRILLYILTFPVWIWVIGPVLVSLLAYWAFDEDGCLAALIGFISLIPWGLFIAWMIGYMI